MNPGFEGEGGWIFGPTRLKPAFQGPISYPPPAQGARIVRLGTTVAGDVLGYSSIRQYFELPDTAWYATLTLQMWRFTTDVDGDRQEVVLLNDVGRVQAVLWRHKPPVDRPRWEILTVDLTPFIGGRYFLYANVFNDGDGRPTALFLDEVHVWVCFPVTPTPSTSLLSPTPTPPASPTATPTPLAAVSPTPMLTPSPSPAAMAMRVPPTSSEENPPVSTSTNRTPDTAENGVPARVVAWWQAQAPTASAFLRATCGLTLLVLLAALGIVRWLGVRRESSYP